MATLVTENPWGGIFRPFDQGLLNRAGMNIVVELRDPVIVDAPAVDQRSIPDRDHFEECGEAGEETATAASGRRQPALAVVNFLRAKYGEAGVQRGTDMWELCAFLDSVHIAYDAREVPVGDGFAAALARNHIALGALWTEYAANGELVPVLGGHIGHWEVGGQLKAQVAPFVAPPVYYPEDNMKSYRMTVPIGADGCGWVPIPDGVDPAHVVAPVLDTQKPDAGVGYPPYPMFSGVATGPNVNNAQGKPELVFEPSGKGPAKPGAYGLTLWTVAA